MKCRQCGLVNFRTASVCKRCGTSLTGTSERLVNQQSEAWRDSNFLVMGQDANLPDRCLKCNSSDGVSQKVISLGYYPKYNLVLLLFGFVYYKTFKVGVRLCERHLSSRWNTILVSTLLIVGGIVAFIVGFHSSFFLFGGFAVFAVGCLLLTIGGSPFSIERFEKPYIWIKGVDEDYLAVLPPWIGNG